MTDINLSIGTQKVTAPSHCPTVPPPGPTRFVPSADGFQLHSAIPPEPWLRVGAKIFHVDFVWD